jgi:hypothetical protein
MQKNHRYSNDRRYADSRRSSNDGRWRNHKNDNHKSMIIEKAIIKPGTMKK